MSDLATLAAAVRSARKRKGWTQPELAEAAQVSLGVVNNLERQKTRPQPANLRAILEVLGIEQEDVQQEPSSGGEVRHWSRATSTALDIMGMYLDSLPEDRQAEEIRSLVADVFERARAQGAG